MVLIFSNALVPHELRFIHWYQWASFYGSLGLMGLPLLVWFIKFAIFKLQAWKARPPRSPTSLFIKHYLASRRTQVLTKKRKKFPDQISTFGTYMGRDINDLWGRGFELLILDEEVIATLRRPRLSSIPEEAGGEAPKSVKAILCYIGKPFLGQNTSDEQKLGAVVDAVHRLLRSPDAYGLVMPADILPNPMLNELLHHCGHLSIPVFIQSMPPFTDVVGLDMTQMAGVIFENACIHPDGERRDFFQAYHLRHGLGRCARQRETRPQFFIGFHDGWQIRPRAATVRRAFKLAKFFGATLQVTPASSQSQIDEFYPAERCLSGFEWLKRDDVIQLHKDWVEEKKPICCDDKGHYEVSRLDTDTLSTIIPGLAQYIQLFDVQDEGHREGPALEPISATNYNLEAPRRQNFWTMSSLNDLLCPLGCYDIGEEILQDHFNAIQTSQEHLRDINMLEVVAEAELHSMSKAYRRLLSFYLERMNGPSIDDYAIRGSVVQSFLDGLATGKISIFRGLDTGFATPDNNAHIWAVSKLVNSRVADDKLHLFVSLKAPDFLGTTLHAYLATTGVPREERFYYEIDLARSTNPDLPEDTLPPRVLAELNNATYAEQLTLLSQIQAADNPKNSVMVGVEKRCHELLIQDATRLAWKEVHARYLLKGDMGIYDVLGIRLNWYRRQGANLLPCRRRLEQMFEIIDAIVADALFNDDEDTISTITEGLTHAFGRTNTRFSQVDVLSDLFALMVFSAFRKYGFEEVYLEATDRCPLFHHQKDQASVFAEQSVLGYQCEIYFDVTPRVLGELIYDRYREYLRAHPPPANSWDDGDLFTAYSKVEYVPESETGGEKVKPLRRPSNQLSAMEDAKTYSHLSTFYLLGIIDILLLTFLGRGLYLTSFMREVEVLMASFALLTALLMGAGVTGWVGSGGSFYLFNFAFDSMNHFFVSRLAGGFMLSSVVSICAFLAFGFQYGWYPAAIFVAYFNFLSPYLNLIGILATTHHDAAPLQSGRKVLAKSMVILLLSPIITTFVNGHDIVIYLPICYTSLFVLLYNYRKLCINWATWLDKIVIIDDNKILEWWADEYSGGDQSAVPKDDEGSRSTLLEVARALLLKRIRAADSKKHGVVTGFFPVQETHFVKQLAEGYRESVWLLEKDALGAAIPEPYTSTWNMQLKVALNSQRLFVRGLKEHSPFQMWRYSKYDVAQNVTLFIIALLDRWVAIAMSANGFVGNLYIEFRARYGIAFGLLYFLSGAIALDSHVQRYRGAMTKKSKEKLKGERALHKALSADIARKRMMYYKAFWELSLYLAFLFGICTMIMWLFVYDTEQTVLYFGYCYGYAGVLIMQFNRVFTRSIKKCNWAMIISALIGFFTGVALHLVPSLRSSRFNDIIALATAATLGVISSYYLTDFSPQPKQKANDDADNGEKTNRELYLQKYLGLTLDEPCVKPKSIELLSDEFEHIRYHPGHNISDQIEKILTTRKPSIELRKAFPALSSYQSQAYIRWRTGTSNIYLTTISGMRKLGSQHSMAVGIVRDIHLDVYTSVPGAMPYFVQEDQVDLIAQVLAGALLHETCEAVFSLSHADAALAETCLLDSEDSLLSRRMRLQLGFSDHRSLAKICERTNVELLRHLTFDQPVNQNWVNLPEDVREMIVAHVENRDFLPTLDVVNWMGTITREPWRLRVERMKLRVRQCLAIHGMANKSISRIAGTRPISYISRAAFVLPDLPPTDNLELMQINKPPKTGFVASCKRWGSSFYYFLVALAKYAAITSGAGYDMGRELGHALRNKWYRMPVLTVVLFCWRACRRVKKFAITIFLFHHRPVITKLLKVAKYGIPRILTARTIIVDDPQNPMTGFLTRDSITIRCEIYAGILTQPGDKKSWRGSCEYDTSQRLRSLKTGAVDRPVKTTYEYESSKHIRHPIRKTVLKDNRIDKIYYDAQGRQSHGSLFAGDREWYFEYLYCATPPNSREILKARYTSLDPNYTAIYSVYWCIVPLREDGNPQTWKPYDKITRLVYTFNERSWDVTWTYAHPRHPTLSTVFLERDEIRFQDQPPREALQDVYGFYKKPKDLGFESEDMLFFHPPSRIGSRFAASLGRSKPSFFSFSKQKVVYGPINTAKLRTILWQQWASAENLDAVSACYIDELILREEPLLREYWTLRDRGHFKRANQYIRQNINIIAATIEITDDVSQNTWLSIKVGDLLTMGGAKDATHLTLRPEDCYQDTYDKLSVTFLDTGCWPDAPGGVSACRRDLVNGHTTIRNHVLVESASDYGVPRHQIERNVNSMQVIPLWGLEGRTPNHGLFDNLLDTQVENRIRDTDIKEDVVGTFIPLLKTLIKGARQVRYSNEDLVTYTNVILNMSKYFEEKDYNKSWRAKETLEAWRQAWMTEDDDANINNPSTFLKIEMPSLFDFDSALELFICYFFVYHCRIPDAPPTVFQSTHHGIGSLYGMILKLRRGVTWGIWDHGLMWRENCLNISTAQCQLAIPVQNMLLGMMKLAANLAYFHADVLLPSTSVYSPDWEVELGTDAGLRQSRKEFRRKIDPVANGTDDMGSLQPVTESISSEPTVVMLSNAQAIKDIKNAIRAADVIINTFGFKNYHLAIYDAIDRVPAHTVEILKIIASRGLTGLVKLGGLGSPKTALKGAWLFMNSSSSEDLPRVIGEAALNGIPIAATEAGAAARVLVDPDDPDARYGEVVPPNDPVALARAQLSLLAMLGPWAKYTEDAVQPPPLPETFTPEDREWISRRMYEKADDRRKLGLRLREVVPRSFHNERYLREHEQMYWAQSFRSKQRRDPALTALAARQNRLGRTCSMRVEERTELYSMWEREGRWQDFDEPENRWSKWQEGNAAKSERRKAMSWLGGEEV